MLFSRPLGCSQVVQLHWRGSTIERGGEVHQACHRWRAQHQTEVRNDARPWQLRGSAQRVGRVCGGAVVCMPGGAYVLFCNHVWLLVFTPPRCLWSQIRASARLRSLLLDVVLPLGNHLNQVCGGAWVPRVSRCVTLTMLVCVGCVCGFRVAGHQEGHCARYQAERVASHH